jgi:XTP/dITP diphosphohydrolase
VTRELLVATRSADKLREIRLILESLSELRVLDLREAGLAETEDEANIEAFDTFADNAAAKARHFARRSGMLVLADDSGLCVDALGGEPGVRSKRFAGRAELSGPALDRANNQLLLQRLKGLPPGERTASYRCAVALLDPASRREAVVEGSCEGVILEAPRGSGGFGYDPLFLIPAEHATFGELPVQRKNQLSHRARAVSAAGEVLRQWFEEDPSLPPHGSEGAPTGR